MNRRGFVTKAGAALAGLIAARHVPTGRRGADPDVPFGSVNDLGERTVTAGMDDTGGWDGAVFRIAGTGERVEHVWALNWDAPYIDRYTGDGSEKERLPFAFTVEMGGRIFRSAVPT